MEIFNSVIDLGYYDRVWKFDKSEIYILQQKNVRKF